MKEKQAQEEAKRRRQSELFDALEEEDEFMSQKTSAEAAQSYIAAISNRVEMNWSRPPSARNGMKCVLSIQLVPTGKVIDVKVVSSSGNPAFDRSAEQAAESLGAGRFTLFRLVTLPMILPGVAGGWLLAFINSFDEVTLSIFVSSPATQTLPVRMYVYATESIDPMMAAVSALVIALTAAAMIVLDRVYGLDRVLVGKH